MKVIYSYVPSNSPHGVLNITLATCLYLSVLKAKQFYEEIEIYTTPYIKDQLIKLGIPFTNIDTKLLLNENASTPSIPKLKTYQAQDKPFIHIDLDTILYQKVLYNPNLPVTFAHPDFNLNGDILFKGLDSILKAYFFPLNSGYLPNHYVENLIPNNIPNMNIVAVTNPTLFSKAVTKSLDLYNKHKEYFDGEFYRFCTIEQLSIWMELLHLYPEYQDIASDRECFLHNKEPFILSKDVIPTKISINNYTKRSIKINSIKDIHKIKNDNFGGYLHLAGGNKDLPLIHTILVYKLVTEFGLPPIQMVINYFGKFFTSEVITNLKELNISIPKFKPTNVL